MKYLITLLLTISIQAQACPDYQYLAQGQQAPCEGYFFNTKMEKQIRKDVRDLPLKSKQLELQSLQIKRLRTDRDAWKSEAKSQAEVSHSKDSDLTKGALYGAGFTLLLIFVTGKVTE